MRFFTNRFPYTNLTDVNLDWIIKKIKGMVADITNAQETAAGAETAAEAATEAAAEALTTAQGVSGIAEAAQAAAETATETAGDALTTAQGVSGIAESAQTAAQAAQTTAQAAQTTAQAAQAAVSGKQDAPATAGTSGQVLGLDASLNPVWVNQSGGGTTDYTALSNKPSINSETLTGNKTSADLGLASASDLSAVSAAAQAAQATANSKQDAITATGMLYRASNGTIRAGVRGTEYAAREYTAILTASAWSANNEQSIGNAEWFDIASYYYLVGPAPGSLAEWAECGVYAAEFLTTGGFKFKCTTPPANNLTVQVIRGCC